MKVNIHTYADKRPDFIHYQYKSLKHFLKDDFEYVLFNNASDKNNFGEINAIGKSYNVEVIKVDWPLIDGIKRTYKKYAALACAHPINWSFHKYFTKKENEINVIIDSDMFLIAPISINEYLFGYDIAAVKQIRQHVRYLWNGIMMFNMQTLPDIPHMNFMNGKVEGVSTDVGGHLYHWLQNNSDLRLRNVQHTGHVKSQNKNTHCLPAAIRERYDDDYWFEIYEHVVLHYGRGSNWDKNPEQYHKRKTELAFYWVDGAIKGDITLPEYDFVLNEDIWKLNHS